MKKMKISVTDSRIYKKHLKSSTSKDVQNALNNLTETKDVVFITENIARLFRHELGSSYSVEIQHALQRLDWEFDRVFPDELLPARVNAWSSGENHTKPNWGDHLFSALPDQEYEIIYVDPPWDYNGKRQYDHNGGDGTGGAYAYYPTVTLENLKHLNVPSITAPNSLLFLWSSSPHLDQAIDLGKSWGFEYKTVAFVWNKLKHNPGHYTLSQCELCLLFKKGKIPTPRGARNIRQYVEVERGRHSEKPAEVRDRIDLMFPRQSKIELFSRVSVSGWDAWGLDSKSA